MPDVLRPGTPEFEAHRAAVARGTAQQQQQQQPGQPPPLNLNTNIAPPPPVQQWQAPTGADPRLAGLATEFQSAQAGLAAGSDADATLALQRARDLQSGQSKALGNQLALQSGFGGARNQQLGLLGASQQRDLASLNADLTSSARAKQLDLLNSRAGLEGQIVQERLGRGQLGVAGTSANNAANLGSWSQQQAATQAAQNLNLNAWQAAQQASAQQQMLSLQAQQANNDNYWRALEQGMNPGLPGSTPGMPGVPRPPAGPMPGAARL
jgi:hypothetical protein